MGCILVPANVKLLRFENKRSTAAVTPRKQTSGTEIRASWDADISISVTVGHSPSLYRIRWLRYQHSRILRSLNLSCSQVFGRHNIQIMDPTRLPSIMIHWKPEGRKQRGRPRRTWKDGIYTAMNEIDLRMGEWNSRRQWDMKVGRRRQMF
jgi:hypothetical protein